MLCFINLFRFIQRCPKEFIENAIFIPIINLAVNTLNLDHREAHSSITKFLSDFVCVSNNAAVRVSFELKSVQPDLDLFQLVYSS
jgi:hypothetical protein